MKILITGGCGFIGSAVVRQAIADGHHVVNVDLMTYAATAGSVAQVSESPLYTHEKIDIRNRAGLDAAFANHRPDRVMHLAAESHVDRSIHGPEDFITTNINGTFQMLEAARQYWEERARPLDFVFHHISTDEVFGTLGETGYFNEDSAYSPNSPYSASKAASDHLVSAWRETYGLPVIITNCSNNYGPFQFPEKLIPVVIINAMSGRDIPVYGEGLNIRDWLYVEDHADALLHVLANGKIGRTYNIGGENEVRNIDLVRKICAQLDKSQPKAGSSYANQIKFVKDRAGHDYRYAIDPTRIREELSWRPKTDLESGIEKTVEWYLVNEEWWKPLI